MNLLKKDFFSQFIATFLGFVLALLLFFIQETIKESTVKTNLIKNVKFEIKYNIDVFSKFGIQLDAALRNILGNNHNVTEYIKYSNVRTYFLNRFYQEGYLINHISNVELQKLIEMTVKYSPSGEALINRDIKSWNEETVDKKTSLIIFEYEKKLLRNNELILISVLEKIADIN